MLVLFTFPGILFVIGASSLLWWYAFFVIQPRRYKPLAEYYEESSERQRAVVGCITSFSYGLHRYGIRRTASGGMEANQLRVTNWLVVEVSTQDNFFIGNRQLEEYFFKFNLGSGSKQASVVFEGKTYLVGSDSTELTKKLYETIVSGPQLQADLGLLYEKPWAHLRVKTERNIGRGVLTKLEYVGFPNTIVDRPEELRPYLDATERLLSALGIN